MKYFFAFLWRDLLLLRRNPASFWTILSFAVLMLVLLGLGLPGMQPFVVWFILMFCAQLILPALFETDFADGTLEQWVVFKRPFEGLVLSKLCVHILILWIVSACVALIFSMIFPGQGDQLLRLLLTFVVGVPGVSGLSVLTAVLALGGSHQRFLGPILSLPLMCPALFFAQAAIVGMHPSQALSFLLAWSLFVVPLSLFASGIALKVVVKGDFGEHALHSVY